MTINSISGAYSSYATYRGTVNGSAIKVSVSEDGLFEPVSSKVSSALSDESQGVPLHGGDAFRHYPYIRPLPIRLFSAPP